MSETNTTSTFTNEPARYTDTGAITDYGYFMSMAESSGTGFFIARYSLDKFTSALIRIGYHPEVIGTLVEAYSHFLRWNDNPVFFGQQYGILALADARVKIFPWAQASLKYSVNSGPSNIDDARNLLNLFFACAHWPAIKAGDMSTPQIIESMNTYTFTSDEDLGIL
jgi:hypothetical protein